MPSEAEQFRDLAKLYWAGKDIPCPKHPDARLHGTFVQTTYADHVFLTCSKGKETITIPQRPRQTVFNAQQVEGMVENTQRGDLNLCYRCQARLEMHADTDVNTGVTDYTFTCTRCFSYGTWKGHPEMAKIGSAPNSGTNKKK